MNNWNPHAQYKGPMLSPTGIPTEYPTTVCPQEIPNSTDDKSTNAVLILCIVVVCIVISLAVCVVCAQRYKMKQQTLAEQNASIDDESNLDNEQDATKQSMLSNAQKGNVGDMYKQIDAGKHMT
eukprot:377288_1